MDSVAGKAHHMPAIPAMLDKRNAIGIMMKNPRKREMTCAGPAYSVEVK